jgi:hypothetical protein
MQPVVATRHVSALGKPSLVDPTIHGVRGVVRRVQTPSYSSTDACAGTGERVDLGPWPCSALPWKHTGPPPRGTAGARDAVEEAACQEASRGEPTGSARTMIRASRTRFRPRILYNL